MFARKTYYLVSDAADRLFGRNENRPLRGDIYTGGGDFVDTGQRYLKIFKEEAGLLPGAHVLDIGSGIGRIALPLSRYLDVTAQYRGFDVVEKGVIWCREHIASKHPNFQFEFVDLESDLYKKGGSDPNEYRFIYPDSFFDFACAVSVFTHLLPNTTRHYLHQTSRVLRPGARAVFTFFTYEDRIRPVSSKFRFPYEHDHYALMDHKVKTANVAYKKDYLEGLFREAGFFVHQFSKGHWQEGGEMGLDFQDVYLLEKSTPVFS